MKKDVDKALDDWSDHFFEDPLKGKRGREEKGGFGKASSKATLTKRSKLPPRERLTLIVKKAPEVMVKITGGAKNVQRLKAHLNYISTREREKVPLENELGDEISGKDGVNDVIEDWRATGYRIPDEGERRKESFHIVLSMPPGTDRDGVANAAREFSKENFERHQWVFAVHKDEDHPHVHLAVKAVDMDGRRMNPRIEDLQRWRELFAEKLREQGIEANATPRKIRGIVMKAEKQAVKHIDEEFRTGKRKDGSWIVESRKKLVEDEINYGKKKENPYADKILASRKKVVQTYGVVAKKLAESELSEDRKLALEIAQFVSSMPTLETRHERDVAVEIARLDKNRKGHDNLDKDVDRINDKDKER